jgi:hypothetical protein
MHLPTLKIWTNWIRILKIAQSKSSASKKENKMNSGPVTRTESTNFEK